MSVMLDRVLFFIVSFLVSGVGVLLMRYSQKKEVRERLRLKRAEREEKRVLAHYRKRNKIKIK